MNKRQALKAAAENLRIATTRIDELEKVLAWAQADIKAYNEVVDAMIQGKAPCEWCEDYAECQLEVKGKKGCELWWLRYPKKGEVQDDDGERVFPDGSQRGIEDQSAAGETETLRGPGTDDHKRSFRIGKWTKKRSVSRRISRRRNGGRDQAPDGSDRQVPDADSRSGTGDIAD
jgi:hypothetical protein